MLELVRQVSDVKIGASISVRLVSESRLEAYECHGYRMNAKSAGG